MIGWQDLIDHAVLIERLVFFLLLKGNSQGLKWKYI